MKKSLFISLLFLVFTSLTVKAQFVLNGSAVDTLPECSDSTQTFRLTKPLTNESGQIWYTTQVSLMNRFDIQFELFLGVKQYTVGADGACFVFQQQSINAGSSGGGLGYSGITPSLAVEFDTYQNGWDPAFCHTAIEKNGDVQHTDGSGNNLAGPVQLSPTNPNLPDGAWHNIEIIWNPSTDSLSMYFDCVFRIGYKGDVIDSIFSGNPNVYWGFTAGTGSLDNLQEVCVAHSYLNNLRDTTICIGNSVQLKAGGGVSYTWSPATGLNADTGATVVATPTATTNYTVTVKNNCGLVSTDSVTITVNPIPASVMEPPTNILCNGSNTGIATVAVTGGTSPYTYSWLPAGGSNATATGLSAGTYTAIVTDGNGCNGTSGVLTVTITQPSAITPSVITDNATCANNDGKISVTVSGGTSPYTYQWNPSGNTNASLNNLSSGNYKVTITDANGCVDTISGNVGIDETFTLTAAWPDSACIGQTITLSASGATNYLWSNSVTSSSQNITVTGTTTYWIVGSTGICSDTITHTINVFSPLDVTKLSNDSICPGLPITLKIKVTGGRPAYIYSWNNGITSDGPGPIIVYPDNSTTYVVTVIDQCSYKYIDSMHVKVFPAGNASFVANPTTVSAEQIVNFTNTSQNASSYYWSFGDGSSSAGATATHQYTTPGTYQVILTAYNIDGCPDTAIEDIDVTPQIIIPNVFTPNGDQVNDVLYFTIGGATCYHCDIYNRWGELVYESEDVFSGWDGKIRQTSQLAADGTYYYIINYCDYKNVSHNLDGFVQLIRGK